MNKPEIFTVYVARACMCMEGQWHGGAVIWRGGGMEGRWYGGAVIWRGGGMEGGGMEGR